MKMPMFHALGLILISAYSPQIDAQDAFSVADNIGSYIDKKVIICGDKLIKERAGEFVLYSGNSESGIIISELADPYIYKDRICVSGLFKRTDGLTQKQAFAKNLVSYTTHIKYDRSYHVVPNR